MDINKNLQKNYKELTKNCKKEYDIPHLISEKKRSYNHLKMKMLFLGHWSLIYFQFLLAALILSIQPQKNIQVAI
jgi:hypothetical protein